MCSYEYSSFAHRRTKEPKPKDLKGRSPVPTQYIKKRKKNTQQKADFTDLISRWSGSKFKKGGDLLTLAFRNAFESRLTLTFVDTLWSINVMAARLRRIHFRCMWKVLIFFVSRFCNWVVMFIRTHTVWLINAVVLVLSYYISLK